MERSESKTKDFSNKQKVFICRVVLLVPVACIISVLLVLLVCMEMLSGQNETIADACPSLNCSLVRTNGSIDASCSVTSDVSMNSAKMTNFSCFEFNVKCCLRTDEASGSHWDDSWKDCHFCLRNLTKLGSLQDSLVKKGSRYIRELFNEAKDEPFKQCEFAKVKEGISACSDIHNEMETPNAKRMKDNTRVADIVLLVFLSLGLVAFLSMYVYTEKALKLCCNRCYADEI